MDTNFFSTGGMGYDSDVNNGIGAGQVYPTLGPTTGQRGSAMSPFANGAYSQNPGSASGSDSQPTAGASAPTGGMFGQPLTWWVVFILMLAALMFAAKKAGQGSEFGNIKASVYNIAVITLASAVGIGFLKVVAGKANIPGFTTYIQAL